MTDKLPHNEDVEVAIIARLLVDPEQIPVIGGSLAPEDFYVGPWRRAYEAMLHLSKEGKAVDLTTLADALGGFGPELSSKITEVGVSYRAPVEEYARIVQRDSFRRRVIGSLEGVVARAYIEEDREKLLSDLNDAVVSVSKGIEDGHLVSMAKASDDYLQSLEARALGLQRGLSWGIPGVDDILNPARGGEMIVLAARPGVGKTVMSELVSDHWAALAPFPVLFASLEMSIEQLFDRSLSRNGGFDATSITRASLSDDELVRAKSTIAARRDTNIWYVDNPYATTSSIRAAAAKLRILAGGVGAIVIDYMQLLKDPGDQEVQRVTKISRNVKALAREFRVPVLVLSQLSRASAQEGRPPRLYDLRESGAIEQDADVVVALSRELGTPLTNFEVLKQRQGQLGSVQLFFDNRHVRFLSGDEGTLAAMAEIKAQTPGGWAVPR